MSKRIIFRRIRGKIVPITISSVAAGAVVADKNVRDATIISAGSFASANLIDALVRIAKTNKGRRTMSRIVMKAGRVEPIKDFVKLFTRNRAILGSSIKRGLIVGTGVGVTTGLIRTRLQKK